MNDDEMLKLFRALMQGLRRFRYDTDFCYGLTYGQFNVLDVINEQGGRIPLSTLHQVLAVEKSTTTRLLDPLESLDLLKRQKDSDDPRRTIVALTAKGRKTHAEAKLCLLQTLNGVMTQVAVADREPMLRGIYQFLGALDRCC